MCPGTFVKRHVCVHICAHTRLCQHTFVPRHVCSQTRLCPHSFVPKHDCAHTCLCPDTLVPLHESWPDTVLSLDNDNTIIVSTRLCVNVIGENTSMINCCWRSKMWLFSCCSAIISSIRTGIFRIFIITYQGT